MVIIFLFFLTENCIPRFLGAFLDPLSRKFSACERKRPLSILNSNGKSALDLREQPWWIRKVAHYFFFSSFGFNLKSGRGTRANLHKNGHKRIRKMFLNSGFESGTDLNKTRKWPLRFSPQLTYFSAQKRRMDFSGFMRGKLDKCVDGKLFLEFLGINWQTGGKGVTEPKENKSPKATCWLPAFFPNCRKETENPVLIAFRGQNWDKTAIIKVFSRFLGIKACFFWKDRFRRIPTTQKEKRRNRSLCNSVGFISCGSQTGKPPFRIPVFQFSRFFHFLCLLFRVRGCMFSKIFQKKQQ